MADIERDWAFRELVMANDVLDAIDRAEAERRREAQQEAERGLGWSDR